jgi:hypothetical protein
MKRIPYRKYTKEFRLKRRTGRGLSGRDILEKVAMYFAKDIKCH